MENITTYVVKTQLNVNSHNLLKEADHIYWTLTKNVEKNNNKPMKELN